MGQDQEPGSSGRDRFGLIVNTTERFGVNGFVRVGDKPAFSFLARPQEVSWKTIVQKNR